MPSVSLQNIPLVEPLDFVGDGDEFFALAAIDHVGIIHPLHSLVGRNGDHFQLVDLPEFAGLGHGRAGHAADFFVELEEILQRDRGQRLRLFLDPHPFLRLDGLVQPVAPLAAGHLAAGEFIDDDHLAVVLDHVVHVALVEMMGLERVVDQVRPFHVAGGVEAFDAGQLFGGPHAFVGQVDGVFFLLHLEMRVFGNCRASWSALAYLVTSSWAGPEMISGVRASSMRMLSTSSMIAKFSGPCDCCVVSDSGRRRARRGACCRADSRSRIRCSCRR